MFLVICWLMVPIVFGAWHYGPGQDRLSKDAVEIALAKAAKCVATEDWDAAEEAYDEALKLLPSPTSPRARQIRLERAKIQMTNSQLPTAHGELKGLVD